MGTDRRNRAFRLRRRPEGALRDGDLELVEEEIAPLTAGQALVRIDALSIDPTNRIWMSAVRGYLPPVPLDGVMRGLGVGEVVESERDDMPVGAHVLGLTGWQEYVVADDSTLERPLTVLPDPLPAPLPAFLGVLGHTGITAYLGVELGELKAGETAVISAAAGAVGSVAGQIAKQRGARVVGIAGGPEKCAYLVDELGFDAGVDYKADDFLDQLDAATPDGIDFDFENVGGEIMDAVLLRMNVHGRVSMCGMISEYNGYDETSRGAGQAAIGQFIMQRLTMRGFLVSDYHDRFQEVIGELVPMLEQGTLKAEETYMEGIEQAPAALQRVFDGANRGKQLLRLHAG
jgi:NADPH2:quinone reductase